MKTSLLQNNENFKLQQVKILLLLNGKEVWQLLHHQKDKIETQDLQ